MLSQRTGREWAEGEGEGEDVAGVVGVEGLGSGKPGAGRTICCDSMHTICHSFVVGPVTMCSGTASSGTDRTDLASATDIVDSHSCRTIAYPPSTFVGFSSTTSWMLMRFRLPPAKRAKRWP